MRQIDEQADVEPIRAARDIKAAGQPERGAFEGRLTVALGGKKIHRRRSSVDDANSLGAASMEVPAFCDVRARLVFLPL